MPSQSGANNDKHAPHYSPPPHPVAPPVAPVAMTAPTIGTSSSPQPVTANSHQSQKTGPPPLLSLSSLDIAHHSPGGGVSTAGVGGPLTSSSSNIIRKLPFINSSNPDTSMSLFSSSGFPTHRGQKPRVQAKPGSFTLFASPIFPTFLPARIMTCQCFLFYAISVVIWFLAISSFMRSQLWSASISLSICCYR